MYRGEIQSTPLLYKNESGDSNMYSFWSSFVDFHDFSLKNYSGDFAQILDFYFEVSYIICGFGNAKLLHFYIISHFPIA